MLKREKVLKFVNFGEKSLYEPSQKLTSHNEDFCLFADECWPPYTTSIAEGLFLDLLAQLSSLPLGVQVHICHVTNLAVIVS